MTIKSTNNNIRIDMANELTQLTEQDWIDIMNEAKKIAKDTKVSKKKIKTVGRGG